MKNMPAALLALYMMSEALATDGIIGGSWKDTTDGIIGGSWKIIGGSW